MPEKCLAHEEAIDTLKKQLVHQQEILEKVRSRPPVWCTVVISLLTFALGLSIKLSSVAVSAADKPNIPQATVAPK